MPPIDPKQLLNALGPLLADNGGIKGAEEASRIIRLMADATKLVNRCIYLNILRVTSAQGALEKFIALGGWDTLNNWLDSARNTSNDPLIGELLEVYLNLPVTVVLLKQNSTAKTIKQLRKAEDEKIQKLSGQLVDRWTKIIRDQNNLEQESEEKRKKRKYKEKEREREKEKDKSEKEKEKERSEKDKEKEKKERERDSEKSRDKDRDSKNQHHHSHSEKDRRDKNRSRDKERDRDKEKDRDKERDRDRHKDRDKNRHSSGNKNDSKELSSIKSQAASDGSSLSKNSKNGTSTSSKIPPQLDAPSSNYPTLESTTSGNPQSTEDQKKEEESRRRPKTVKQFGGKFRSLGLSDDEGDADVEPVKKKVLDKPATLKRVTSEKTEDMAIEKKPRLHLSMPPLNPAAGLDSGSTSATPPDVTHGRIKIIPPKRAPAHEIHESNVFMDALQQSSSSYTYGAFKRKKKLVSPSAGTSGTPPNLLTSTALSGTSPPPTATSPPVIGQGQETQPTSPPILSPTTAMAQRLPSVPSFYRDTLDDLPESSEPKKNDSGEKGEEEEENRSPPVLESMEIDEKDQDKKEEAGTPEENEWGLGSAAPPKITEEVTEPVVVVPEKPTRKKSVTWATDAHLEEVFYFELDETERENVNRPKSFMQMKRDEMMLDRRAVDAAKRFINDNMVEVLQWRTPRLIEDVIVAADPGCNSKEREIQMEREKGVLCALFFNKVPDTPIEPDPDIPGEQEDTKLIPLEDENGSCTEYEHTYNQNDPSSLPYDPEFDLPIHNQGQGGTGMGPGPGNMGGNNFMNNGMGNNMKTMGMNLPPALSHMLQTLQQQAQETRDPLMANLQTMLSNVLQTTNPQDTNMLMERVLNTLEQFRNQIPGLHNLISAITNSAMDGGNMGGPRPFMNPPGPQGPMGGPRHGLLGPHPPGFNMMGGGGGGGGGGSMRPPHPPPMQGPGPMMGGGGGNPNFFMGKPGGPGPGPGPNMDKMRMGGPPPNNWRGGGGGGGRRPYNKRGRSQICQHFINKGCKYGDSCGFIHPANGPNS